MAEGKRGERKGRNESTQKMRGGSRGEEKGERIRRGRRSSKEEVEVEKR